MQEKSLRARLDSGGEPQVSEGRWPQLHSQAPEVLNQVHHYAARPRQPIPCGLVHWRRVALKGVQSERQGGERLKAVLMKLVRYAFALVFLSSEDARQQSGTHGSGDPSLLPCVSVG